MLLDTHVWLWAVEDEPNRLGARTRALLRRINSRSTIRISAASVFEVVALHAAGRLRLASPPEEWIRDALSSPWVRVADLTPSIAVDGGYIPRTALADPIDRLLVATARHLDVPLVTADRAILQYASASRAVNVRDASR